MGEIKNSEVKETDETTRAKNEINESEYISNNDISDEEMAEYYKNDVEEVDDRRLPVNNGIWEGEKGNSKWIPDDDYHPKLANPENKSWSDIKAEYDIEGIEYKGGEPDFECVSKGEVKIDEFTEQRYKNFTQADIKEAEKRGCSPSEVREWRQENNYTWHELDDCSSMQKVPSIVHNNMPHSGGISEIKKTSKEVDWEGFEND